MENKITEFYEKIKDYKYIVLIHEPNHTIFGKVLNITLEKNYHFDVLNSHVILQYVKWEFKKILPKYNYRKNLSISFEVLDILIIKEDNINEKNIKSISEELFLTYREELHKIFDKIEF